MRPTPQAFILAIVAFVNPLTSATLEQNPNKESLPPWDEAHRHISKGTHIEAPRQVKESLAAKPEDCRDPSGGATMAFDSYSVALTAGGGRGLAMRGVGSCFCSATGNCAFWVLQKKSGRYQKLLETAAVQNFGFLSGRTDGYRDLVVWTSASALQSSVRLYQFDGEEYRKVCGWEEEYDAQGVRSPQITLNSCTRTTRQNS